MTNITIKVSKSDIRKLEKRFGKLNKFDRPLNKSLLYLQSKVDKAPPKSPGAFSRLATPKQKRAYWAQVSRGIIRHGNRGYIRTGNTIRKWTTRIQRNRGILGNNAPGARWLYDTKDQQPFHEASGWPRVDKLVKKERGNVVKIFERQLREDIRD